MKKAAFVFTLLFALLGCKDGIESRFPMEKRYWRAEDYDEVIRKIKYSTPEGERFPEFNNPETAQVIKKLVDHENFLVTLTDDQLGLSHRSQVASSFFQEYRDMANTYNQTDRQDKFQYGMELVEILKFGLDLQLHYFKLGNDNIIKEADDPESSSVRRLIESNEQTVFKNYNTYLDFVNSESSFDQDQLTAFAEGIDLYFLKLFETFPNGNTKIIRDKAELMLKKAENESVKSALNRLIDTVNNLQP